MRTPGIDQNFAAQLSRGAQLAQKAGVSTGEDRHSAAKLASSYEPATNLALHSQQHER